MKELDNYIDKVRPDTDHAESISTGLETILQNCKIDELKYSKSFLEELCTEYYIELIIALKSQLTLTKDSDFFNNEKNSKKRKSSAFENLSHRQSEIKDAMKKTSIMKILARVDPVKMFMALNILSSPNLSNVLAESETPEAAADNRQ